MAIKLKLTKEEFEKLSKDIQEEYSEKDGAYVLDVDGYEDPAELRRARDRERAEKKALKQELEDLRKKRTDDDNDDARKEKDIARLEKLWKEEQEKTKQASEQKIAALRKTISENTISAAADSIASLFTTPTLIRAAAAQRLRVEFDEETDAPKLIVVGADGKPAGDLEALKKEFLTNKEYEGIRIVTKASGGGASRGSGGPAPGGAPGNTQPTTSDRRLVQMAPDALLAHIQARVENKG